MATSFTHATHAQMKLTLNLIFTELIMQLHYECIMQGMPAESWMELPSVEGGKEKWNCLYSCTCPESSRWKRFQLLHSEHLIKGIGVIGLEKNFSVSNCDRPNIQCDWIYRARLLAPEWMSSQKGKFLSLRLLLQGSRKEILDVQQQTLTPSLRFLSVFL